MFGGNNTSGAIFGHIILNIEESGCTPIKIDELYLGGYNAAYSVYGYYENGTIEGTDKPKYDPISANDNTHTAVCFGDGSSSDHTKAPYADPILNVISATYIGKVFGGGLGADAIIYGNPTVNINQTNPLQFASYNSETKVTTYSAKTGALGSIGENGIFGGGNEAPVYGNTTVNIGNQTTVDWTVLVLDDSGQSVLDANEKPLIQTITDETFKTVLGANIAGNIYGGGNLANVTGNTNVNICAIKSNTTYTSVAPGSAGVTIAGNVFGGGKGDENDVFECAKAMVGIEDDGVAHPEGGTTVVIGNGTVTGNVYGGGEIGRVEKNTVVTIGTESGTSAPIINGDVFGAGSGILTHGYSALVRGNSTVTIQSGAKVKKSVYGGGEIASVGRYTLVDENNQSQYPGKEIGMPASLANENSGNCFVNVLDNAVVGPDAAMEMTAEGGPVFNGNIFGGGKGVLPEVYAYVKTNKATMPKRMMKYNSSLYKDVDRDKTWEYIENYAPSYTGTKYVWEYFDTEAKYLTFIETLALATQTDVTIGAEDETPFIKGSVYGGSENGIVQHNTQVTIAGGQIGCATGMTVPWTYEDNGYTYDKFADASNGAYSYTDKYEVIPAGERLSSSEGGRPTATDGHTFYGNVFGGGSGYFPYAPGKWHRAGGSVGGDTQVDITGGHILSNVYGGNEQTDVGTYTKDSQGGLTVPLNGTGKCTINMSGGTIGVPRTKEDIAAKPVIGNLFGAGKGDKRVLFNTWTNVRETEVNVTGGIVYGSVFGGGEDGHVMEDAVTEIEQASGKTITIGSTGESGADGNVFGGGRGSETALTAGVVGGNVSLTINSGTIKGSVYGGGRLASVGTNFVNPDNEELYGKLQTSDADHGNITITINNGTIGNANSTGVSGNVYGGSKGTTSHFDLGVIRSTTINMTGGTAYASVYGGGELAQVVGSHTTGGQALGTEINISGGTIGTAKANLPPGTTYGATYGNVYGGGKGNTTHVEAGLIKTNTKVSISQASGKTTLIRHNIYGGGAYGSVGTFTYDGTTGFPNGLTENTGTASVTVTGGTIGSTGKDNGMVFGSSRGSEGNPETDANVDKIAWVGNTIVTIGTQNSETGPSIKGSVYGGGENGHNFQNASVTVHSGTIGIPSGEKVTIGDIEYEGARFPNRGNVYGSGCGTDTYIGTDSKTYFDFNAGIVRGNTTVLIDGGHVVHNVYGGGAMGSVGTYTFDANGKPISCADETGTCTVTVSGGKIGVAGAKMDGYGKGGPDDFGHVFGAGRGEMHDPDEYPNVETCAYFNKAILNISGTAFLTGSAYGGSESGHVLGDTEVNISGGQIGCGKDASEPFADAVWADDYTPTEDLECASWPFEAPFAPYDTYANATGNLDQYSNGTSTEGGRLEASDGHTYYGNVFGGGSGSVPYFDTTAGISKYLSTAGTVEGNTKVTISGGHILTNVYGGCEATNVKGSATIKMTGGTVGVPRTDAQIIAHPLTGYVFGAGKGDQRIFFNKETNVNHSIVTVEGGRIYGSVYGGGEDGHVLGNVTMTIGKTGNTGPTIGTRGTSYYDGHVFGGGRGFGGEALTAGNVGGAVTLDILGGQILGSVYGGGRLASVGYGLYLTTEDGYGQMRDDDQYDGSYPNPSTEAASTFYNKGRGKIYLTVSGGTIGNNVVNDKYGGNVYGGSMGRSTKLDGSPFAANHWTLLATVKQTTLTITEGIVKRNVYGGGELGAVKGAVLVNVNGGTIEKDVYGGGALANTNTWAEGNSSSYTTTVNLLDGLVKGDAYGGGLGQKIGFDGGTSDVEATVYGDITLNLGDENATKATKFNINYENTGEKDEANNPIMVVQSGRVFGCNNLNGSPRGDVTVNVYKTVEGNVARTEAEDPNVQEKRASRDANVSHTYELAAVYGGGNLANYTATGKKANVIIHTCDVSVQYVYGGGNAAAVPGTDVLVKGAWEIDHVFGGGNGKDMYKKGNEWILNAGADVAGNTNTLLIGGYIHEAYGGSNEKGTIGGNVTINTVANDPSCACALELTKLYGAGKNADIEGDLIVVLDCAPETKTEEIYGGAENANVKGNVELTITSGSFGKVFGGNNQSGAIFGHIILNVEETSCRPINIDYLYGCGNNAAYSVYGYKDGGTDADGYPIYVPRTSENDGTAVKFEGKPHTDPGNQGYADPEVNIISCTRIGQVFGGGLGSGATVYGNPTVNIDQIYGKAYVDNDPTKAYTETATTLGVIGDVFGGGNAANVVGNTNVNIGTRNEVWLHQSVDGNGNYTRYPALTDPGISVVGANITGNVYGGGNEAEVTGNTNVNIGKKE